MNNWGVKALSYTLLSYNWSITWVLKNPRKFSF